MSRLRPVALMGLALVLILPAFGALAAQSKSLGAARADLRRAMNRPGSAERRAAIEALAEHGEPAAVSDFVKAMGALRKQIAMRRVAIDRAIARRVEIESGLPQLKADVEAGKLGRKKLEETEKELEAAKEVVSRGFRELEADEATALLLRKAVGWSLQRCSEAGQIRAGQTLERSYKRAKGVEQRLDLLQTFVWTEREDLRQLVAEAATSARNGPERTAALVALAERGGRGALNPAIKALKDDEWQVRAAAIAALKQVGGKRAAEALVTVLSEEEGRLRKDAKLALQHLTGENFHDNVHLWNEWITKNGDRLREPTEESNAVPLGRGRRGRRGGEKRGGTGFYGIDPGSKHLVYVIDFSGSMDAPLKGSGGQGGPLGQTATPKVGGPRKVDGVATQLLNSVRSLPDDATFNVVLFATEVRVWQDRMVRATPRNKEALKQWVLNQPPGGSTNFFGGLEKAFSFAGRGTFDRGYKTSLDTILMLSDGSPTAGRLQKAKEILEEVGRINKLSRISIHCVGLGRALNAPFLQRLASENGGEFVHVY
jgi:hypothetical protein